MARVPGGVRDRPGALRHLDAPWYLIPTDHKWYRNWAVSTLLLEHFEELDPRYPESDFDVAECRIRLLEQP